MNLQANIQTRIYGLERFFFELIDIYKKNKLPNKILLTGEKGCGKSTLAYHFINYVLSQDEVYSYNETKLEIQENNRSFKLVSNKTSPNFELVDINEEKKNIDINQIRNLISNLNKSSFNTKPRFVLLDNIEYLNKNSINALLKVIEEPNPSVYFILINNSKNLLATLKSRCLEFRISLTNKESIIITNKILGQNILDTIDVDLLNFYQTPGNIFNIFLFSEENQINLKNLSIENFLRKLIDQKHYKKNFFTKRMTLEYIEMFFLKKINFSNIKLFSLYDYFLDYYKNTQKYNLDEESFFIEFKSKLLNG